MTNKAHSTLTGTDLHEPKGADSAAADTTYVANGSGSGVWQKLTAAQLTGTASPFNNLFYIREEQPAGVATGSNPNSGAHERWLTTIVYNDIGASNTIVSNIQFQLPAGTYWVDASTPVYVSGAGRLCLFNVDTSTYLLYGANMYSGASGSNDAGGGRATLRGRFTLSGATNLTLRLYSSASGGLSSWVSSFGSIEIYTEACFWKIG